MKKSILTLAGLLSFSILYAQSLYKLGDYYASLGLQVYSANEAASIRDYKALFPGSAIIPKFDQYTNSANTFSFSGSGSINLATSVYRKNKSNNDFNMLRAFRVGVSFFGKFDNYSDYFYTTSNHIDTVTSNNGSVYYIDSVYSEFGNISSVSQNLVLDASMIFRTNSSKRWKLYSGFGLQAGLEFNRSAIISQTSFSGTELNSGNNYSSSTTNAERDHQAEKYDLKASFIGNLYIPIGIDWKTGDKRPFFQQLHLFAEFRPSLMFSEGLLSGMNMNPGFSSQFGIRIQFLENN